MAAQITERIAEDTVAKLMAEGFTASEIAQLLCLRQRYQYIDITDSQKQWEQLQFLRWLYQNGHYPEA
jgi:hypothetical protein